MKKYQIKLDFKSASFNIEGKKSQTLQDLTLEKVKTKTVRSQKLILFQFDFQSLAKINLIGRLDNQTFLSLLQLIFSLKDFDDLKITLAKSGNDNFCWIYLRQRKNKIKRAFTKEEIKNLLASSGGIKFLHKIDDMMVELINYRIESYKNERLF